MVLHRSEREDRDRSARGFYVYLNLAIAARGKNFGAVLHTYHHPPPSLALRWGKARCPL